MSKNRHGMAAMEERNADVSPQDTEVPTGAPALVFNPNVLGFHSQHPKQGVASRVSYVIPGVSGNLVVFKNLFLDGTPPVSLVLAQYLDGVLTEIQLTPPKADVSKKADREAAAAAKLVERAAKAQLKIEAQQAKALERQQKAEAQLAAAKAKIAAATAAAGAPSSIETPFPSA